MKTEVEIVKKSSPVALIILLLVPIILLLPLNVPPASAHKGEGYSHDDDLGISNPKWMARVPNETLISELSIPGTHESVSYHHGDMAQCQSLSLYEQLESGIRAIDIRVRVVDDKFRIWHGDKNLLGGGDAADYWGDQHDWFENVLSNCTTFLANNPTETIFMRLSHEDIPAKNSIKSFLEIFETKYWNPNANYFWMPTSPPDGNPNRNFTLPTLGDVRTKIVLFQGKFSDSHYWNNKWYGLNYDDEPGTFEKQDEYKLNVNWDLYHRWNHVLYQLELARQDFPITDTIVVNCLNGAGFTWISGFVPGFVFPYFVASGHSSPQTSAPRLWTGYTDPPSKNLWPYFPRNRFIVDWILFEGTNELTFNYLKSNKLDGVGIIYADFPGPELIEYIIRLNPMPRRAVNISPVSTPASLGVEPGSTVTYILNVTNRGDDQDTYDLSLIGLDTSWYTFSEQPVPLPANASKNITLNVTPARNWTTAPDDYNFMVTIQSSYDPKCTAGFPGTITVLPFHEPKLFVMPDSFGAQPGDTVTYTIGVQNIGNVRDDYNMTAEFINPGGLFIDPRWTTLWPYVFWGLDPGITGTGYLEISVPEDWATIGLEEATYNFTVYTECQANSTVTDEVERTLNVTVGTRTLSITPSGEFDYTFKEPVTIKISALVKDIKSRLPISNANVTIKIHGPNGDLLWADPMVEMENGTGVYTWESEQTIQDIMKGPHWQPFKGVYTVRVEASYNAGPISYETLEFHLDPPAGSASTFIYYLVAAMGTALVALIAGLFGILKIRKKKTKITQ